MDGYTGKRTVGGLGLSRNSGISFRDPKYEDRSSQCCNRIGCSTRHSSTQNSIPEKPKYLKPPLRFKSNNSSVASSSRSFPSTRNFTKPYHQQQSEASDAAESSTRQAESGEDSKWEEAEDFVGHETSILHDFSTTSTEQSSSSSARSVSRYRKQINQRFGSAIQDTASSVLRRSSAQKNATQVPKTIPQGISDRPQRSGLRNLSCASIADVFPSSSFAGRDKRAVSVRRKIQEGEGSSNAILSLPEQQVPHGATRQTRNRSCRDAAVSVRTRFVPSGLESSRMRLGELEDEHLMQLPDPILLPQLAHAPLSIPEGVQESSQRPFSDELPSVFEDSSPVRRPGLSSWSSQSRFISHSEDRDDYGSFNMEGIEEVLRMLQRIERGEELAYEELLVLEANIFLGGLSFHDQHRDMRLDIDNMSYEELLALEEKMGTVSTALSEEEISKYLKRCTYRPSFTFAGISHHGDDDFKCSICQEEYLIGEEVGMLPCQHHYHVECIRQWLSVKNWCPICKAECGDLRNRTPAMKSSMPLFV